MKALIVTVNVMLAGALAWAAVSALSPASPPAGDAKRSGSVRKAAAPKSPAESGGKNALQAMTREQQVAAILAADMFNPERTPNASGRRGNRLELSLVGTFEAGEVKGAVILQRTNTRQVNPFMRMMWGGMPGGGPPPGGPGGVRRFNFGMNGDNQRRPGINTNTIKQYVRLGETMPNGYTLTALSRTRATLTRGGDKMELELQNPSKNQNTARRAAPRMNMNQQLQQAQLATQQMMVRALMEMRNQGGGGAGAGNRGGNRGGAPRPGR